MATYLVTGGAGFIGSNIVEELLRQGERVQILDNFSTGKRENIAPFLEDIELIEGDLRHMDTVREATEGGGLHFRLFMVMPLPFRRPRG